MDSLDLRDVTAADVYLDDDLVATLTRDPADVIRFDYQASIPRQGLSVRDQLGVVVASHYCRITPRQLREARYRHSSPDSYRKVFGLES